MPFSLRRPSPRAPLGPLALAVLLLGGLAGGARAQSPHGASMSGSVVEGEDFLVYDDEGRARSFAHILEAMDGADVVLVGESHDDAVGHGVEAQLFIRAAQRFGALGADGAERPVVLSLEMFERDVQYVVDEYLDGLITEDQFLASARPWDNYRTDYRPMVEVARAHGLPVVAANAPRRYVNRVSRLGPASLEALGDEALRHLPPLPYPGPSEAYRGQWDALMAEMMAGAMDAEEEAPDEAAPPADSVHAGVAGPPHAMPTDSAHAGLVGSPHYMPDDSLHAALRASPHEAEPTAAEPSHDMGYALQAQALWDAAMGHAVAEALERRPGGLVLHFAGSFHVARHTGIPERVPDYRPGAKLVTVVLRPEEDIRGWSDDEHEGLGDFVVLTRKPEAASPHGG